MAEFLIPIQLMSSMAHLVGGDSGPLSPWTSLEAADLSEAEVQRALTESQLSRDGNILEEEVKRVVERLMNPTRYVRLRLQTGPVLFDYVVYFPSDGGSPVCLSAKDEGFLVRDPAPIEDILYLVSQHLGRSDLKSSPLDVEVSPSASLTLLALTDLFRQEMLLAASKLAQQEVKPYTPEQIVEAAGASDHSQRLVTAARHYLSTQDTLTGDQVHSALAELQEKSLVESGKDGWELVGDGRSLAGHFPLIGQFLRLDAWQLEEKQAAHGTILALQAGLHDNLYLDREEEQVILKAVSSNFLYELTEELIGRTDVAAGARNPGAENSVGPDEDPLLPPQSK